MTQAFKEWALVCEALGSGRQSLLIRKGGIAEGRDGFSFRYQEFFLFPTWFHEQLSKTRLAPNTPLPVQDPETVTIRLAAKLEWTRVVRDRALLPALREYHIWADEVIEERFDYNEAPGVHVAFVRIFHLDPPHCIRMEPRYGGCRSWVELPEPEGCALVSVLSDEEHARRRALLEKILADF
jgi:hypothetical protein